MTILSSIAAKIKGELPNAGARDRRLHEQIDIVRDRHRAVLDVDRRAIRCSQIPLRFLVPCSSGANADGATQRVR